MSHIPKCIATIEQYFQRVCDATPCTIAFQHGKFILLRCYGCKHIILHCEFNSKEFAKSDFAMKENVHLSTSNGASSSQASLK